MTGVQPRFLLAEGRVPEGAIASRQDLVDFLRAGERPDGPRLVGVELERLPLRADGTAAPFAAPDASVSHVLRALVDHHGHAPVETEGVLLGLEHEGSLVHLEPGGQVELALAPQQTASDVLRELRKWRDALVDVAARTGVHVAALGLQPVTPVPDITWVPKRRYEIMGAHLGARGRLGHHMMKATAGVQFTFDHASEQDAGDVLATTLALSPVVNALAANSPLEAGRPNGLLSGRPAIWRETDPDRTGYLPWVHDGYSHDEYVEWALDVPLLFVVRDERWIPIGDRTFRRFLEDGDRATGPARHADWALHLTTLFPEVRMKQHVEVRGADSTSVEVNAALAALWRGVIYDADARSSARDLTADWTPGERDAAHVAAGREGLAARVRGTSFQEIARALLRITRNGLSRLDRGDEDARLLDPLEEIAVSGRAPALALLDEWSRDGADALLRRV